MEMEIPPVLKAEIDRRLAKAIPLGGISISEVLTALGSEPKRSKNLEYF